MFFSFFFFEPCRNRDEGAAHNRSRSVMRGARWHARMPRAAFERMQAIGLRRHFLQCREPCKGRRCAAADTAPRPVKRRGVVR